MKIYDCFVFYNELELLELRLKELNEVVDYFVLVESSKTFTGLDKELVFAENRNRFSEYNHKIIHVVLDELPTGNGAWEAEFFSRNAILNGLTNAADDDLIIISDVDEIPNSSIIKNSSIEQPNVLAQRLYYYFINCWQNQIWYGSIITKKKFLTTPQDLRDKRNQLPVIPDGGWHFSFLGGAERIVSKIKAYAETDTCHDKTTSVDFIKDKIMRGEDIFDRTEDYTKKKFVNIDSTFPSQIKSFIEKYPDFYTKVNDQFDSAIRPTFSVVIPTYNQAEYLPAALESLFNQTFTDWEAVVVNDGSNDKTCEVMEKYAFQDPRIKVFYKENGGVATALNVGINNSRGEWICWLSSDDLFEPDKLETHFNAIKEYPEIKFFHSHWYLLLEETQQKIAPPLWLQIPPTEFQVTRFFWANYIHGNAIAIHRSVFDEVGLFNEALRQGQDFDMWLRISSRFVSFYLDKRTCITRIHKGQTTNSFVQGGVLDSTRSLILFLNSSPFESLFPFTDFRDPRNIIKAINEIIYISTKQDAFLYRCGFTTALVEKTVEWFTNKIPVPVREKVFPFIKNIVDEYLSKPFPEEIKNVLKKFLNKKKSVYTNHNFLSDTKDYVNFLLTKGDQKQARSIETYLQKISKQGNILNGSGNIYEPILLGYPEKNEYKKLDPVNIRHWIVEPGGMLENSIKHSLKVNCSQCEHIFNIYFEYEMKKEETVVEFICPECKQGFQFSDKNFELDFVDYHNHKIDKHNHQPGQNIKIAFLIRDASVLGGGTKIVFKHIEWLIKLGTEITVYSFSKKPNWVNTRLKYVQIKSDLEIKTNSDLYVVFSIFDVPFILNRIPISKVVHLCQGYEGYHYGRDYDEMRADKHILTKLHAIPVKNISVSKHLVELFNTKFERISEYIPNGIDHRIFSFNEFNAGREKSILFIGNPLHPLKGFSYLGTAIKRVQNSPIKIDDLKLNIVMGYKPENIEQIIEQLADEMECTVDIKIKLSSSEVAELTKRSSVVVCTSWYEGFSMPLIEAMACGTPVITTYNLGAQSFCRDKFNSLTVDYGDINSFAQHIIDIMYHTNDLSQLLSNAYNTSLEYSEHYSAKMLVSSFENLLNTKFDTAKTNELLSEYHYDIAELVNPLPAPDCKVENPQVSIVIPVFNQLEYTKLCIESLVETIDEKIELVIVNNASNDGTKEFLSSYKNDKLKLVIIANEENLGFPKAVNLGIDESNGKYVVIANNDILFNEGWLSRMIEVVESDSKIGLVGPISNEVSGLQKDEKAAYKTIDEMKIYAGDIKQNNKNQIQNFPRLAFLCTLIKREVIEAIGGLDERFSPGNYEDDDYCLRAQLAGFKAVVAKDVFIHHYGSKSFKADGNNQYSERLKFNREIFVSKWGGSPEEIWLKNKQVNPRQYYYPINRNRFIKYFERTKIHLADNELNLAEDSIYNAVRNFESDNTTITYEELLNLGGNISLANNNLDRAAEYFETELTENSNSSSACLGLGQVLLINEQYEQSKVMFEWAVRYDHSNEHAIKFLAEVNEKLGLEVNHITMVE
ncbi:MAG: glycosyltransferase [Melioribacteraceae bacterium]|nr:glycosyltransferase [Melioribacteraceae bacterium]